MLEVLELVGLHFVEVGLNFSLLFVPLIKHTLRNLGGLPKSPHYGCSSLPTHRPTGEGCCHSRSAKHIFHKYLHSANLSSTLTLISRNKHIKDGFEMAVRISIFLKLTRFFYLVGIYHSRHFLHSTPDHRTFEEIFFALNWHLRTWIINCRPSIGGRENHRRCVHSLKVLPLPNLFSFWELFPPSAVMGRRSPK